MKPLLTLSLILLSGIACVSFSFQTENPLLICGKVKARMIESNQVNTSGHPIYKLYIYSDSLKTEIPIIVEPEVFFNIKFDEIKCLETNQSKLEKILKNEKTRKIKK